MIDFESYVIIGITLIANAFCTGIGVSLGIHFVNKNLIKKQEQEIDVIVEKVLKKLEEKQEEVKYVPRELY